MTEAVNRDGLAHFNRRPIPSQVPLIKRFQAKWRPVRVKKTRQIKNLEPRFDSIETEKALEAPRDIDGLLLAATPGHRYGLGRAARHIGSFRRYGDRRKSMRPIPGDGIGVGVLEIA